MHKGGWKPFWAALGAALLVLLPLVGGTVLLTRQMLRQQWLMQTAEPQRSVPIDLPKADDRMTLLLCTAGEQPGWGGAPPDYRSPRPQGPPLLRRRAPAAPPMPPPLFPYGPGPGWSPDAPGPPDRSASPPRSRPA